MKYAVIKKSTELKGELTPPGSKSECVRRLLFAILAKGESQLFNMLQADDTEVAVNVCRALGADIKVQDKILTLYSNGLPLNVTSNEIHTGSSGISTRFLLPLLGLRRETNRSIIVNCSEQMRTRPIKSLIGALRHLGMQINYLENEDRLPIAVQGALTGGDVTVSGITSQYLSALLISLPCAPNDSVVTVQDLHERPYVAMTQAFLREYGVTVSHQQTGRKDIFYIPGNQVYSPKNSTINGDFSSAAAIIAAACLVPSEVHLLGLNKNDSQGDKRLISILQEMGADLVLSDAGVKVNGYKSLTGIDIDANDIPDLVPILAVLGTKAFGKMTIKNVSQARLKETDRIHSMASGLRKMGAKIEEHADGLTVYQSQLIGATVNGYADHRTVMALIVAGFTAQGVTKVSDVEHLSKTYPQFIEHMQSLGANVVVQEEKEHLEKTEIESKQRKKAHLKKHIILFGFKHVGKTQVGLALARKLKLSFIDLDVEIEACYQQQYLKHLSVREIMQKHGEVYFRELETETLRMILTRDPSVISLGGGTVLNETNQQMIASHQLLHVVAARGIVFERIMVTGRPAFLDSTLDPYEAFNRLWNERHHIYTSLTQCSINNNETIEKAVDQALRYQSHEYLQT